MSRNPYRQIPIDKNSSTMDGFNVLGSVLQATMGAPATSSVVTLTDNTTIVEVTAIGNAGGYAAVRWISSTNTNPSVIATPGTANFDYIVPVGVVRRLAVPNDPTLPGITSVVGLNRQAGLFNRIAVLSAASVMTAEF